MDASDADGDRRVMLMGLALAVQASTSGDLETLRSVLLVTVRSSASEVGSALSVVGALVDLIDVELSVRSAGADALVHQLLRRSPEPKASNP